MSRSAEAWADQEALAQEQQESEMELHYSICKALDRAKELGLENDHLVILCHAVGINSHSLKG